MRGRKLLWLLAAGRQLAIRGLGNESNEGTCEADLVFLTRDRLNIIVKVSKLMVVFKRKAKGNVPTIHRITTHARSFQRRLSSLSCSGSYCKAVWPSWQQIAILVRPAFPLHSLEAVSLHSAQERNFHRSSFLIRQPELELAKKIN